MGTFDLKSVCKELIQFIETHLIVSLCETTDTYSNFEHNIIQKGVDVGLDSLNANMIEYTDQLEAIRIHLNHLIGRYENNDKNTDYIKIHETEKTSISLIATKRRCALLKKDLRNVTIPYISSYNGEQKSLVFQGATEMSFVTQTGNNESIQHPQIQTLCKNISLKKTN